MALRPILIHPDPRLKKVADPVADIDADLGVLIDDMFETMYAAPGIGLAAPQIGVLRRLVVMDCAERAAEEEAEADSDDPLPEPVEARPEPIVMINPEIVDASAERSVRQEGCLSIPEQYDDVTRPAEVTVRFLDRAGAPQERRFAGLAAACAQHEIDHLNGKLFIDYLGPVKRTMITQKMKKLKRERAKERADRRAEAKP